MSKPSPIERIRIDGTTLAYQDEGAGEPLIFIHGSASDYRTWHNQSGAFAGHFRTITYSRRFHFPNEPIPDQTEDRLETHIEDLLALIGKLNVGKAHIVGHSWGGLIAMKLGSEQPSLLKTLTLIEPPAFSLHIDIPPTPAQVLRLAIKSPRMAIALAKFVKTTLGPSEAAFRNGDDEAAVAFFGRGVLGRDRFSALPKTRYDQVWDNRAPDRAQALFSKFPSLPAALCTKLRMPVLLVAGQESPKIFRFVVDDLSRHIPHARVVFIGGASHIVHEDAPHEFNVHLMEFLNSSTQLTEDRQVGR